MKKLLLMAMVTGLTMITIAAVSANASVSVTSVVTTDSLPVLDNSGTFVLALNYKGGATSQDGVTFQSVTHVNNQFPSNTVGGVTVALDTPDTDTFGYHQADLGDDLWQTISYTDKGVDAIVKITGLDNTKKYQAQFLLGEPRGNSWANYVDGPFSGKNSASYTVLQEVSFGSGSFDNMLATVEVSGSPSLTLTLPGGYGLGPAVAGIVIHDLGADDVDPNAAGITTEETDAVLDTPLTFQLYFSEEIDTALTTGMFSNAGTAVLDIDSVTLVTPGNYYDVVVIPATAGTIQLRLDGGLTIFDYSGNSTTLSSDVDSDVILEILQAHAAFTTFSGDWNTQANWDPNTPSGLDSAFVSDSNSMTVSAASPIYEAGLTLGIGSSLSLDNAAGVDNALSTLSVTMGEGSYIGLDCRFTVTIPTLIMDGNGEIVMSTGTGGHGQTRQFDSIEGAGTLTIKGNNQNYIDFNEMNLSWSGGLISNAADRYVIRANAFGCFGSGDVTVNPRGDGRSATIRIAAHEVFDAGATLSLSGIGSVGWNYSSGELIDMQTYNATVNELYVNGVLMAPGTYTGTDGTWIKGTGTLTVLSGAAIESAAIITADKVSFLGETITINAVVTGTFTPGTLNYNWDVSYVDDGDVVVLFDDTTDPANPTITVTTPAEPNDSTSDLTSVEITFTVDDGTDATPSNNTLTLDYYKDACLAARMGLDLDAKVDFDNNCLTDIDDLAVLAVAWLTDTGLDQVVVTGEPATAGLVGELGILDLTANDGMNPATAQPWAAGDNYRLVFTTSGKRDAASNDIEDYNVFVQAAADAAGLGGSWKVIGSTDSVDARDNVDANVNDSADMDTNGAVFLVDGTTLLQYHYVGFWKWAILSAPNMDEYGNTVTATSVATGSIGDGTADNRYLGGSGETPPKITTGKCDSGDRWLWNYNGAASSDYNFYAMSAPLTVVSDSANSLLPTVQVTSGVISWSDQEFATDPNVVNNDDEPQGALSYQWTAVPGSSDPDITVIFDPSDTVKDPIVTIIKEAGSDALVTVELTLAVTLDGEDPVEGTMMIDVYDNSCDAAIAAGQEAYDYTDVNTDCLTNLGDFAEMAEIWMGDYSLTQTVDKPAQ